MNGRSKIGLTALAFAGILSVSTTIAEAKGFSAGFFSFKDGTITLANFCLRANGTFVQPPGGGISGRWVNRTLNGTTTGFLWGNASNTANNVNLSVIALGVSNSKWTLWFDDNSFSQVVNSVRITKISNACP